MALTDFLHHRVGDTPLHCATRFCPTRNLYVKLEQYNPHGSIKERTAYFILEDLLQQGRLVSGITLVESSSGNLGLSLGCFCRDLGVDFVCLIDPTLPAAKVAQLTDCGVQTQVVQLGNHATYRDARIHLAMELETSRQWIWTRQYDNPANVRAHACSTGPEIWSQMAHNVDFLVASVGTGGTICGVGQFLKNQNPHTTVVAVEPYGSTIFGGEPNSYLSVGSGMSCASEIIQRFGAVIDYYCHIKDCDALNACRQMLAAEGIGVGVTAGSVLVVARQLAQAFPERTVVAIAADGIENYTSLFADAVCHSSAAPVQLFSCPWQAAQPAWLPPLPLAVSTSPLLPVH